jgi:hypothetical protein
MGLIREPKNVDFTVQSKPWTAAELRDFRKLMTKLKAKNRPSHSPKGVGKPPRKLRTLTGKKKVPA